MATIAAHGEPPREDIMRDIYTPLTAGRWRARFPEMAELYQRLSPDPDFSVFFEWLVAMWRDTTPSNHPQQNTARIACPALLIGGDEEHLVPGQESVARASRIPGASLGIVPFGSPVPHWDRPELVEPLIATFLEQMAERHS